jgi:hypothetical protein
MVEDELVPASPAGAIEFTVILAGDRTLRSAEATLDALREAAAHPGPVRVDCRGIEAADISFLQLLMSAKRYAAAKGLDLAFTATEGGPLHRALLDAGIAAPAIGGVVSLVSAN